MSSKKLNKYRICSTMPHGVVDGVDDDNESVARCESRAVFIGDVRWQAGETIRIAFMGGTNEQRTHVVNTGSTWLKYANLKFVWDVSQPESDVRVAFEKGKGSWSFMGRQCRGVDKARSTMNLGWLPEKPAAADVGTILHEFGHMLGLAHEHHSPNGTLTWRREVVIKTLGGPPNNWSEATIQGNVFAKYKIGESGLVASAFDPQSIMLYSFPAEWTEEGVATKANEKLSREDKLMISEIYPTDGGIDVDDEPINGGSNKCACNKGFKDVAKAILASLKK